MAQRKMSAGLQVFGISRMLSNTRWDNQVFDVSAHVDRSLHYDENVKNIRSHLGISTRNKGLEQLEQRKLEAERERKRREDTLRQTGKIQSERNREIDRRYQAMRPGKRHSAAGSRYYERRENRSDRGKYL